MSFNIQYTMSEALNVNKSGIDLDDIQDIDDNILAPEEDKELQREGKKQIERQMRNLEKEKHQQQKQHTADIKIQQEAGLYDGETAISLRAKIMRFKQHKRLGKYLAEDGFVIDIKTLNKMKTEQLTELLDRIRTFISNRTNSNSMVSIVSTGLLGVENIAPIVGLKIQGLTQALNQNDEFSDLIDEIVIENGGGFMNYIKPEYRLAVLIAKTSLIIHWSNKRLESMSNEERDKLFKPKINPDVEKKNSDLL